MRAVSLRKSKSKCVISPLTAHGTEAILLPAPLRFGTAPLVPITTLSSSPHALMSPFHYRAPIYQAVTVRVTLPTCVWQRGPADTGRGRPGRGRSPGPPLAAAAGWMLWWREGCIITDV